MLGHLSSGGQFDVKQSEVASGYWEPTLVNVDMNGKALFFKTISVQQKKYQRNFRRVPDGVTLPQAADSLRQQVANERSSMTPKPNH